VRVVSLVPSATETLVGLGVVPLACTRFCDLPDGRTVGGTKNPDVAAIVRLRPDLVVVNDEENRIEDADALQAAGITLHSMSPRSLADVVPAVDALCDALGRPRAGLRLPSPLPTHASAFIATWRRPYMTMNSDTYGSSLLAHLGLQNVFAGAPARYPEITLEDAAARVPDVVLLPDEPYPFTARHLAEIRVVFPQTRVELVDGRDLFWWGWRTPDALTRLATLTR
jgi:ABC-type Fe3+-hydroxamate transport system substrate-binding protein